MAHDIRVGTSGWQYDHWRGPFYPEDMHKDEWFKHYASVFDTVEINNTFYRQPGNAAFDRWKDDAPKGFLYALKANRYLTHMKKLKEPEDALKRFLSGAERLKSRLGPLVYQLPPNWKKNLDRLERFAKLLPRKHTHVVEFRDRDWLDEDVYEVLEEHHVCLCVHDMIRRHPRRATGPAVYVRFHGAGEKYGGSYRRDRLESWADWMRSEAKERPVYVYFNNDEEGNAVRDAGKLKDILGC